MEKHNALIAVLCAAGAIGCSGSRMDIDAGRDSSITLLDTGPGVDAGPIDAGDVPDAGEMIDAGDLTDSGPDDAGTDACMPATCGPFDCGMVDPGCGEPLLDCGVCATGAPCAADADCASMECIIEADSGWLGGYCTAECREDTDCAPGAHCAYTLSTFARIGVCLTTCALDADCRGPEYTCQNADMDGARECAPSASGIGGVGDRCATHSECAGGDMGRCFLEGRFWREGYCTLECLVDTDCGAGAHCGAIPIGGGTGTCYLDCTTDADCRADGYACSNYDEDPGGVLECGPAGTGTGIAGDPCVGLWECTGGTDAGCYSPDQDFLGGYCTSTCMADADCGAGNHCTRALDDGGLREAEGVCTPTCAVDTDCRLMGYVCRDANDDTTTECWPGGTGTTAVGDACDGTWECAGGERAYCARRPQNDFDSGYCILFDCEAGGTGVTGCPTGSHCSIFITGGVPDATGICTDDCATDADCRTTGYRCIDLGDVDTANECWPAATGTGAVGDPCRWQTDCAGEEFGTCLLIGPDGAFGFPGGYCSEICGAGTCPTGSGCFGLPPVGNRCFDTCAAPLDCRMPDYTCEAAAGVCVPAP